MTNSGVIAEAVIHRVLKQYGIEEDRRIDIAADVIKELQWVGVVMKLAPELPSIFDINDDVISALKYRKKLDGFVAVESFF